MRKTAFDSSLTSSPQNYIFQSPFSYHIIYLFRIRTIYRLFYVFHHNYILVYTSRTFHLSNQTLKKPNKAESLRFLPCHKSLLYCLVMIFCFLAPLLCTSLRKQPNHCKQNNHSTDNSIKNQRRLGRFCIFVPPAVTDIPHTTRCN